MRHAFADRAPKRHPIKVLLSDKFRFYRLSRPDSMLREAPRLAVFELCGGRPRPRRANAQLILPCRVRTKPCEFSRRRMGTKLDFMARSVRQAARLEPRGPGSQSRDGACSPPKCIKDLQGARRARSQWLTFRFAGRHGAAVPRTRRDRAWRLNFCPRPTLYFRSLIFFRTEFDFLNPARDRR